jgi:hypothetical protein
MYIYIFIYIYLCHFGTLVYRCIILVHECNICRRPAKVATTFGPLQHYQEPFPGTCLQKCRLHVSFLRRNKEWPSKRKQTLRWSPKFESSPTVSQEGGWPHRDMHISCRAGTGSEISAVGGGLGVSSSWPWPLILRIRGINHACTAAKPSPPPPATR